MKFCKDCEFFRCEDWGYWCSLAKTEVDPVTGHEEYLHCYEERGDKGVCGPEGKNFKPSLSSQVRSFIQHLEPHFPSNNTD